MCTPQTQHILRKHSWKDLCVETKKTPKFEPHQQQAADVCACLWKKKHKNPDWPEQEAAITLKGKKWQ